MPRKTPLITVSAVVTPAMAEEIASLARANRMTKSQMVRQLLEERLVQRVNQRTEDAYDRLEKRLKKIEDRFSGLVIACTKLAAQTVYIAMTIMKYGKAQSQEQLDKHWNNSIKFAAEQVSKKMKGEDKAAGKAES